MSDSALLSSQLERAFKVDGLLARAAVSYKPRHQQLEMAQRIAQTLSDNGVLICEAGTGTGKTFAYLVPMLLAGGRVILSTGTKTLQDQLFERDLPVVRDALGVPATLALLKGRANYVCHYHLERALEAGRVASRSEAGHLRAIARFMKQTTTGDRAELDSVPEDSGAWRLATSTRDNCLGKECPHLKLCFVAAARRAALDADIVVVNHHLFFADVMLRDEGLGELLPACNAVVFDEAHQLPEVAGMFFGQGTGTPQILDLTRDVLVEALIAAKDYPPLQVSCKTTEKAARDLRLVFGKDNKRVALAQWQAQLGADAALSTLMNALVDFSGHLEKMAGRSEGLDKCVGRLTEIRLSVARWQNAPQITTATDAEKEDVPTDEVMVRWAEITHHHVILNMTPLSVANIFQRQMASHPRTWVFTSATLAVAGSFTHYQTELGLLEAATAWWGSPFNYEENALLYSPQNMPAPNSSGYHSAVAAAAWPVIKAARGRSFVLCTSLAAMRVIHQHLREYLDKAGLDWPLLLQGEASKSLLLEKFRHAGNAILVASVSFWEGVDVRGEALSLVVIDKLPFAPPDDPVLAARIEHMQRQGKNPFFEYQLPRAVINMKQGAGRLIRDENDRGVLMVCDPRLVDSSYGKKIWRSLPPMKRTREIDVVEAFFQADVKIAPAI